MSQAQPDGHLAMPPAGRGPPGLVLHAWWGLNDDIRGLADRLAEPGRPDAYNPEAAALAWERTLAFLRGAAS